MKKILILAGLLAITVSAIEADNITDYKKACDGGDTKGCENYKIMNQQGY
ncbi:MAG: hypothetical protein ACXWB0_00910 [Sulfuricurvum sp.]